MLKHSAELPDRTADIRFIVLHTPSVSFAKRAGGTAEGAVARYDKTGHKYYGHGIVAPDGAHAQLAPYTRRAWHSAELSTKYVPARPDNGSAWRAWAKPLGSPDYIRHNRSPEDVWDWWDDRWPDARSPLDIIRTRHPNNHSIGLDLMPTVDGDFPRIQLEAAAALCCELLEAHGVTARMGGTSPTVVTHSDIDPMRRGAVLKNGRVIGKDWDLGSRFDYAGFAALLRDGVCS